LRIARSDDAVADLDVLVELPEDGVVLEQVRHGLGVAEVVDRNDLEVPAALEVSPKEVASNTPESVDPNPCLSHKPSLNEPETAAGHVDIAPRRAEAAAGHVGSACAADIRRPAGLAGGQPSGPPLCRGPRRQRLPCRP